MKVQNLMQQGVARAGLALALAALPLLAQAGTVVGSMTDKNGQPVADAVFYAMPELGNAATSAPETIIMTQENYRFEPYVSVLRKGTVVKFTNKDSRDHHIKSFSLTKAFEMRVPGKGESAQTVVFDKVGDIVMVCHFHDFMRGFVYVVDTPYFLKTDKAGSASLNNLPAGKYQVMAWVPNMLGAPFSQNVQVNDSGQTAVSFKLDFVPKAPPIGRTPSKMPSSSPNYNPY